MVKTNQKAKADRLEEVEERSVSEKINSDFYKNKVPFVSIMKDRKGYEAYCEEEGRMNDLFHADLAREYGVVGNKKEPLLWRIAWDQGHSSGYNEIWIHYAEMVELIK